jgi:predicted nucleotidyltransferase
MRKVKSLPEWVGNGLCRKVLQSGLGVVASNWVAQSMLYAETTEVVFKLSLELAVFFALLGIYSLFGDLTACVLVGIGGLTHTVTFFINGHFFNLGRFLGIVRSEARSFIEYPQGIGLRLKRRRSVMAVVVFGSLSKGRFSDTSDLDVRVIAKGGFIAGYVASFWVFLERFRALLSKYPLDIYTLNTKKGLEKINPEEPPIILFERGNEISHIYHDHLAYSEYRRRFLEKFC